MCRLLRRHARLPKLTGDLYGIIHGSFTTEACFKYKLAPLASMAAAASP